MNNETKLRLYISRKLVRVTGTNSKGAYDMIATLGIAEDGKVHDVTFDPDDWDDIAAEGVRVRDDVWVKGVLHQHTDPAKRYTVNKGTADAYERLVMSHAQPVSFKALDAFRGKLYPKADSLPSQTTDKAPNQTQQIPAA